MKHGLGRELKQMILWATVFTLLLFILVIGYFMIDVAVTTNKNIEKNKQMTIDQSVVTLQEMAKNLSKIGNGQAYVLSIIDPAIVQRAVGGDMSLIYETVCETAYDFYPVDYIGLSQDGKILHEAKAEGLEVEGAALPVRPEAGDYITLDELGNRDGFFVSLYYTIPLSGLGLRAIEGNFIVDRTRQMQEVEEYYTDQRNSQLLRMSIAAVIAFILAALLTTIGLRMLASRFIMKPIDELNEEAEGIITGTFEGEVPYDKDSTFAPIQGLLRSGQKVLYRMDSEIGE